MEKNSKHIRTNYPAELRSAGLELAMTIMTQYRFGFDMNYQDMSFRREQIQVKVDNHNERIVSNFSAQLTYDGFYSLVLPVGKRDLALTINFGEKYQWLEIISAELLLSRSFLSKADSLYAEDLFPELQFQQITLRGGKLYQCEDMTSAIVIPAMDKKFEENYLARIVFRPTVIR